MTAKRPYQAGVSISVAERQALVLAARTFGTSESQYIRQPLIERLVREGFMQHPAQAYAASEAEKVNGAA
jgi:hypothetical protein